MTQAIADDSRVSVCAIHGWEPVSERYYLICGECWHVFVTADELLTGHDQRLVEVGVPPGRDTADQITVCPLCTHDF